MMVQCDEEYERLWFSGQHKVSQEGLPPATTVPGLAWRDAF